MAAIETPSDRDYACLFCTNDKSKDLDTYCRSCSKPFNFGPTIIGQKVEQYKLVSYKGRGYYGMTFKALNRIEKPFALKLVPTRLYTNHEKSFDDEIIKYRSLGDHPNIATLEDAGNVQLNLWDEPVNFHFILMEWVEGDTLREFCKSNQIDAVTLYGGTLDMASAVARFEECNLWHNDLNADNVIVRKLSSTEVNTRRSESPYIFKIIDTGSAVFRQSAYHKRLDDIACIGQHIKNMAIAAKQNKAVERLEDDYFLDHISRVVSAALDESPGRRFHTANALMNAVTKLFEERVELSTEPEPKLRNPFEYLNANDFPNEQYISRLFSDKFPWIRSAIINSAQSLLVTGPRGSGKTMVLRSLRLRARLSGANLAQSDDDFIAFFVSARIDIGNYSLTDKVPPWMQNEKAVIGYFHLLFLYEIVETIYYGLLKKTINIRLSIEKRLCQAVEESTGFEVTGLSAALAAIKRRQIKILNNETDSLTPHLTIGAGYLGGICKTILALVPEFANKRVIFLLDDFSVPKIPEVVQKVLLPIIWNPGAGYTFVVTSHSESMERVDARNISYLANREFKEINLGAQYISSSERVQSRKIVDACVDDIFSKRVALTHPEKTYSIKERLGVRKGITIAKEIRKRNAEGNLRGLKYHGWDVLLSLCSGDISSIIDLVGQMVEGHESDNSIPSERQNSVIKQYARRELNRLQDHRSELVSFYQIALNFGRMSRFKLTDTMIRESGGERPAQYLRIEVEQTNAAPEITRIVSEILRYGLFIDGGFSSNSQGAQVRRLIFKKLFTPVFPTTYVSRDTFPMTERTFLAFAKNPEGYLKDMLAKSGRDPEHQQLTLDGLIEKGDE